MAHKYIVTETNPFFKAGLIIEQIEGAFYLINDYERFKIDHAGFIPRVFFENGWIKHANPEIFISKKISNLIELDSMTFTILSPTQKKELIGLIKKYIEKDEIF